MFWVGGGLFDYINYPNAQIFQEMSCLDKLFERSKWDSLTSRIFRPCSQVSPFCILEPSPTTVNMSHHEHHRPEGHAQAKIKLLASPLITKQEISPSASAEYFNHHENTAYDAEPGRPHQINDNAMHETPQFQRVSTFV